MGEKSENPPEVCVADEEELGRHCVGLATNDPKYGGFQLYTVCKGILVSPIPDWLSFEQPVVLPLAISTAATGLFKKDRLALPYPTNASKPTGKTVLVWGGSSSVGSSAIQLAAAAGVIVVTVASSHNLQYVKSLGTKHAFDYKSPSVVDDIVSAVRSTDFAGVFNAISMGESSGIWSQVLWKLGSGGKYASTLPEAEGVPKDMAGGGGKSTIAKQPFVGMTRTVGLTTMLSLCPDCCRLG